MTGVQTCALPIYQIKRRSFLYEALDLLFHLPQKSPSETPQGCRIFSPELRNAAAVFLRFRTTWLAPAANSWPYLVLMSMRTPSCARLNFSRSKSMCPCSTRRSTPPPHLRSNLVAVTGSTRRRRDHHRPRVALAHLVVTFLEPKDHGNAEYILARAARRRHRGLQPHAIAIPGCPRALPFFLRFLKRRNGVWAPSDFCLPGVTSR